MNARLVAALVVTAVVVFPGRAKAVCQPSGNYELQVSGNTVTITPFNQQGRACPYASGMLRQNAATLEVVRLADFCAALDGGWERGSYVDECVPAGDWRYGFAIPYSCEPNSCRTLYYGTAVVVGALDPGCQRSPGNTAPEAQPSAPWGESDTVCTYSGREAGYPRDGATTEVVNPPTGCSTTPQDAALNVLVVLLGLLAVRRA